METTGLFNQISQDVKFSQLCLITKDRIELFLPGLWDELFKTTTTTIAKTANNNEISISNNEEQKLDNNEIEPQQQNQQQQQQQETGNICDLKQISETTINESTTTTISPSQVNINII